MGGAELETLFRAVVSPGLETLELVSDNVEEEISARHQHSRISCMLKVE